MQILTLFDTMTGVSAFSTLAGFNVCTYAGAPDVEADLLALERFTGIWRGQMYFPVQTHGAEVRVVAPGVDLNGVDGVVCTEPGVLIGVHTADCLPLLLVDTEAGVIAAVHCGWRGTVAGIVSNAVEVMTTGCGAVPERIHAAMGPCICPGCFEVGEEVACQFPDEAVLRRRGVRPHIDLPNAVSLQLRLAGISDISLPPACSKCDFSLYSVRRLGRSLSSRTLTAISLPCGAGR